jgi:ABC-type oligopeptide transport system substrate-binding subunit
LKKLLTLLLALGLVLGLAACGGGDDDEPVVDEVAPVISGAEDVNLTIGDTFDELEGISATDDVDGNLTSSIVVSGSVSLDAVGSYELTYTVEDAAGNEESVTITVTVSDVDVVYPTGFFNYKFADTELRHTFMAAAEKYIMNNMAGGVPLFASGSFNLYSSRLQLPVDEYVAVMGYGTGFATMSADDSTVLMDDGEPGEAGEYTYRTTMSTNPVVFNQWLYDTSTDSDLMSLYYGALYSYEFNADKTGYEVNPSMAASNPVPVDSTITDTGKEVSTTWQITLRDDLVWKFHPDVLAETGFDPSSADATIDANDFVGTYKLALEKEWFRAISGGGDFINSSSKVLNAEEFVAGDATWEEVGIKLIDDLTFEFTFVDDQSEWNVRYFLSSFVMSPVNLEMYDFFEGELTGEEVNPYGTNNFNIGYHGAFYIDYYEADKIVRMLENDVYHNPDEYFYTGYSFAYIEDAQTVFQEFIAGKLEATGLPTAEVENYENDPRLRRVPGATVYRMMINGLGSVEAQREQFPDGSWVPEPLLGHVDFKMAMFFAIDRQTLAEDILKVRTTTMYYFSNAYLVDAELGVPYRSTEQGMSVGEGLSPETFGYNFDASRALYLSAVEDLIASGDIVAGTEANPTVITIELNNYSNSESWDLACGYLKTAFEETFQDTENHVYVEVEIFTKDFPAIYYDYMMIGEFDTSVGGISGSTLDAASFLDTYSSDNRSGFTINWGIDTSVAEIEVVYELNGERHREMWAFDAISAILVGEKYIIDGEEAEVPAAKDAVQTPTTVTFTVSEFDNVAYENITYTMQYYDLDLGYLDVEGKVDVPVTAAEVTVEGLLPFYYGYDETGAVIYQGDYQIVIEFGYAQDAERSGSTISPWFEMGALLSEDADATLTETSVLFDLSINTDDAARAIDTVEVYEEQADESFLMVSPTVDFSNIDAASISGLTADTFYVVKVTFDDGQVAYLSFSTEAPAAS